MPNKNAMLSCIMSSLKCFLTIGAVIFMWGWLGNPHVVFACSCVANLSTAEQFENATTVFVGTVGNISQDEGEKEVTFVNVHTWKGSALEGVVIKTGMGGGDCGFDFEVDREYIVFGYGVKNIETSICSGTQLSTEAQVQNLDRISEAVSSSRPTQVEEGPNILVVFVPAIISFIAGLLVMYGIKKRRINGPRT